MDEQGSQENPPVTPAPENVAPAPAPEPAAESPAAPTAPAAPALNQIDLSALSGFSFGTQWSTAGDSKRERGGDRRDDRGERREGGGDVRRDRRQIRRPFGDAPAAGGSDAAAAAQAPAEAPRQDRGDRPFRGGPGGPGGGDRRPSFPRGDRPAGPGGPGGPGGDRPFRGPRQEFSGGPRGDRPPRFEGGEPRGDRGPRYGGRPVQDNRPYLSPFFEIQFFAEDNAFVALVKAVRGSCHTYELFEIARVVLGKTERFVVVLHRTPDAEGKRQPIYFTPVDGLPFENEDEAVQYVLRTHLDKFFDMAEVEVEAPKGNFQFVNRCSITGDLLAPPNYHRYQHILQQHHASKLGNMPFERFRERIETVKDPELVNQWLEKMKKTTRYTWKAVAEGQTAPTFDSLEEARTYLLAHARDKVVRSQESIRFHGRGCEGMPDGEIRRAIEGQLERQRRFPLDTANSLRGRLRREGFTIFKRGSKGVSFVCSVKRKFRLPGQTFSESISALISHIEANPLVSVKDLPQKHLGLQQPEAAAANSSAAVPAEGAAPTLSAEDQAKLKRLWMDLRWLVTEGYVTEYSDGKLFAPPPLTAQQQKSEEAANAAADAAEDAARAAVGAPPAGESAPAEAAPAAPPAPEAPAEGQA